MIAIGEILDLSYGKALKESERDGGVVPVVGSGGVVGQHSLGITDSPTIVVGRKGSIGTVTWIDGPAWPIDTAYFVRPKSADLDRRWMYWMLRSLRMETMNKSAAIPGLNRDDVYRIEISLPPFARQRRIAAILDHADGLRLTRRQVLAHFDSLAQAVFHDSFGSLDSFARRPLGEIADLRGGRSLVAQDASSNTPFRVLKISAVTTGRFRESESKPLPVDYVPPNDHLLRDGDLLMSRANTSEMVGAVALVENPPSNLALPDKLWRFVWREPSEPVFYHALLSSQTLRRSISRLASGTGGSMKNISKEKLRTMAVPDVPLQDQRAFAETASKVERQRDVASRAVESADQLLSSLQSRAFRGDL